MARKPLTGTVAANVLRHGTGALNIDACRVEAPDQEDLAKNWDRETQNDIRGGKFIGGICGGIENTAQASDGGRWPANVIHDGSDEVLMAFPDSYGGGDIHQRNGSGKKTANCYGQFTDADPRFQGYGDAGTAARFFYSAKAGASDRLGSKHPTVKPIDLMAYLLRLVTPPGGVTLDPFAGSGSTGMAAMREGFDAILIEREAEHIEDIKRRMAHVSGLDTPLFGGTEIAGGGKKGRLVFGNFAADKSGRRD